VKSLGLHPAHGPGGADTEDGALQCLLRLPAAHMVALHYATAGNGGVTAAARAAGKQALRAALKRGWVRQRLVHIMQQAAICQPRPLLVP
jgi:hypothetical protein